MCTAKDWCMGQYIHVHVYYLLLMYCIASLSSHSLKSLSHNGNCSVHVADVWRVWAEVGATEGSGPESGGTEAHARRVQCIRYMYMYRVLGTDLKPQAHCRTIRTVSKSSGQFQSRLDSFKAVGCFTCSYFYVVIFILNIYYCLFFSLPYIIHSVVHYTHYSPLLSLQPRRFGVCTTLWWWRAARSTAAEHRSCTARPMPAEKSWWCSASREFSCGPCLTPACWAGREWWATCTTWMISGIHVQHSAEPFGSQVNLCDLAMHVYIIIMFILHIIYVERSV